MDKIQYSIITGSLLGDGSIEREGACFSEQHTENQKDYLRWKYNYLQNLCNPNAFKMITRSFGKVYRIRTKKALQEFRQLRKIWYPNGNKIIPKNLDLDELALTVWYLDDGDKIIDNRGIRMQWQRNCVRISTGGFTYKENLRLVKILHKQYGIQPVLRKEKNKYGIGYYRLYFQSKNQAFDKLMAIVKECFLKYQIPKCMQYKIGERVESRQGRTHKQFVEHVEKGYLAKDSETGKFISSRCAPSK